MFDDIVKFDTSLRLGIRLCGGAGGGAGGAAEGVCGVGGWFEGGAKLDAAFAAAIAKFDWV